MSPAKSTVWLPLTRLTAFFVAVVVIGNLLLRAVHPPPKDTSAPPTDQRSYERTRRNVRDSAGTAAKALGWTVPLGPPSEEGVSTARTEPPRRAILFDPVVEEPAGLPMTPPAEVGGGLSETPAATEELPASLDYLRPVVIPPGAIGSPFHRTKPPLFDMTCPGCGRDLGTFSEWHSFDVYSGFAQRWEVDHRWSTIERAGDALFNLPDRMVEGLASGIFSISPAERGGTWTVQEKPRGFLERLLNGSYWPEPEGHPFARFMGHLIQGENRFIAGFRESRLNTFDFEDGNDVIEPGELWTEQRKILLSALRKTYLDRFEEMAGRVRDDAYQFRQWRGVDYVVAPSVIAAYTYFRGIDRKFSIDGTRLRLEVDPIQRFVKYWGDEESGILPAMVSVEWGPKNFPVKLIVTAGLYGGQPEIDFIGIGTGVGEVRRMLDYQAAGRK